jgi:hypothetical protein
MSRTLKLVLLAAILEMFVVAIAAAAWHWDAIASATDPQVRNKMLFSTGMFAFFPACLVFGSWLTWKIARSGFPVAPDTRRYNEITLMAAAALAAGTQAWAVAAVLGFIPKGGFGFRLIEALTGVFFMVAGNFVAKTSPPTGEHAPDPAAWTRGMLRIGWVGVAAGLAIIVASITVAIDQMIWVIFIASAAYLLVSVLQHRAMRRTLA